MKTTPTTGGEAPSPEAEALRAAMTALQHCVEVIEACQEDNPRQRFPLTLEEARVAIAALAALAQLAPTAEVALPAVSEEVDGWATVPNSATHNMLNAANAGREKGRSSSGDIYRAMIEAAPKLARAQSTRQSASVAGLAAKARSDLARDSLKDSLRLDWCERHAVGIENNRDMDGSSVWDVFGTDNSSGKTLRAAIDAAAFPATPTESQEKAE